MAYITRLASDITGKEGNESEFVRLVVRTHPVIDSPVELDALPAELKDLTNGTEFVVVEIKDRAGGTEERIVPLDVFQKLVPDDKVKAARGTRGRRPGSTNAR